MSPEQEAIIEDHGVTSEDDLFPAWVKIRNHGAWGELGWCGEPNSGFRETPNTGDRTG